MPQNWQLWPEAEDNEVFTLKFYKKPLTPRIEHLLQGFLSVTESALWP